MAAEAGGFLHPVHRALPDRRQSLRPNRLPGLRNIAASVIGSTENVSLVTVTLPESGDSFIVIVIPSNNGGYNPIVISANNPDFKAGDHGCPVKQRSGF